MANAVSFRPTTLEPRVDRCVCVRAMGRGEGGYGGGRECVFKSKERESLIKDKMLLHKESSYLYQIIIALDDMITTVVVEESFVF